MTQTPTEALSPVAAPAPPRRETGYAAGGSEVTSWWNTLSEERTPELRWPYCLDVYDDMMTDPQVFSVLRAVMMPILGTTWRLDGTGCTDDVIRHCSNDLGLPVVGEGDDIVNTDAPAEERFSWSEHLEVALEEELGYGHSYHEQSAYWGDDGRWHLRKLGWRPPRSIAKFNVARDGGLVSIEQKPMNNTGGVLTAAGTKNIPIPIGRLVAYVHRRKGANWTGRSLLRPAYGPWLLNNRAKRVEMIYAERHASPLVTYTDSENGTPQTLADGEDVAKRVRSGDEAGAALPYGAKLELQGATGTLPDIGKIKTYNDDLIGRVVLAHFLNLGQAAGTGSYALGVTFQDFFTLGLQAEAELVRRVASRHIVRDLVTWTWGPAVRAPKLVFDEIGSRKDSIVHAIAALVSAGVLQPDEDLEKFTRLALGLPPRGAGAPVLPGTAA